MGRLPRNDRMHGDTLRAQRGSRGAFLVAGPLLLTLLGCWDAPNDIAGPAPDVVQVQGQVHLLPGQSLGTAVARVQWDDLDRQSQVAADGSFAVGLPRLVTGTGLLTIAGGSEHPAWVRVDATELDDGIDVILVPKRWTVTAGAYQGQVVDIDPSAAADSRVLPSFWNFIFPFLQDQFLQTVVDSTRWLGQLMTWPDDAFPLPVVIDRDASTGLVSEADSVALWERIDELEAALGWDAFEPGRIDDMVVEEWSGGRYVQGAVTVRVDSEQATRGLGGSFPEQTRWFWDRDAADWSGGPVRRVTVFSADFVRARVGVRENALFEDPQIIPHELMHVLGPGHGCTWPSLQTYCASLESDVATAQDIGYLEVLMAVRRLDAELDTPHGIAAAVFGQRVLSLGLAPVPAPDVVFGPENAPLASSYRNAAPFDLGIEAVGRRSPSGS